MVIRELFAKLGLMVDESQFQRAEGRIGQVKTALSAITAGIGLGIGQNMFMGVVEIGKRIARLTAHTAEDAFEGQKAAMRAGITNDAWDELEYAAQATGVSVGSLQVSLRFLNRAMEQSKKGGGEVAGTFRDLGIQVGKTEKADELMGDLAEKFAAMEDGPKKTATAIRLFGRAGTEMIPLLNLGRDGIDKLRDAANKFGFVFDEKTDAAARKYVLSTKRIHLAMEGLRRAFVKPLMIRSAETREKIADWLLAHAETLRSRVEAIGKQVGDTLNALARAFMAFFTPIGHVVRDIIGWLSDAAQHSRGLRIALGAVGAVLLAVLAHAHPLTLGLTILLGVIEELWGWISGERETVLEDIFGPWTEFKAKHLDPIIDGLRAAWDWFGRIGDSINGPFSDAWEALKPTILAVWGLLKEFAGWFGDAFGQLAEVARALWTVLEPLASLLWAGIKIEAKAALEGIAEGLRIVEFLVNAVTRGLHELRNAWRWIRGKPSLEEEQAGVEPGRSYGSTAAAEKAKGFVSSLLSAPIGGVPDLSLVPDASSATTTVATGIPVAPPQIPAPAMAPSHAQAAPIQIDSLVLQGAPTDAPREWAEQLFEALQARQLQDAHAAVAR